MNDQTLVSRRQSQSRLQGSLALLVIVTGALILVVLWRGSARRVDALSQDLVRGRVDQMSAELESFFRPVRRALEMAERWGADGQLDPRDPQRMATRFQPLLETWGQVSSMLIAEPSGAEFMLLRTQDSWLSRTVDPAAEQGVAHFRRWGPERDTPDWTEEFDYDSTQRPWFLGAVDAYVSAGTPTVYWTDAYPFFTTQAPGITAAVATGPQDSSATRIIAFDVLLSDLSRYTTGLDVGTTGFAVVLAPDGDTLGLPRDPRFASDEARREAALRPASELGVAPLTAGLTTWHTRREDAETVFAYASDGEEYWAGLRPLQIDGTTVAWMGVFVPEGDFLLSSRAEQGLVAGILIVALTLAIALTSLHGRRVHEEVAQAVARATRLGQYTLVRKLGSGGMGTVFLARHAMLRRPTAIKLLNRENDPVALTRFEREVQATASLTHPNTISIYDYGRTPENVFYYAMEYLPGIDLKKLVERYGAQPPGRVVHILAQVCASLAEAHDAGLIHRDVKPANIVLTRYGGVPDFVKVLDFGLVKDVEGRAELLAPETANELTRETVITGTPHFLAPEAITGDSELDARTDLYAVGAVAYYLLTGQHVFDARTAVLLLAQQVSDAPRPPSERIDGGVPADLERVILDCLAKSPDARPNSAAHLRDLFLACTDAPPWTEADATRWWFEHGAEIAPAQESGPGSSVDGDGLLTVDLDSRVAVR